MWDEKYYRNYRDEWTINGKPVAQIEKSNINGKYSVWIFGIDGKDKILKGALHLRIAGIYGCHFGDEAPSQFDTEQAALEAYQDYRRRNPLNTHPQKKEQQQIEESETVKTLFE